MKSAGKGAASVPDVAEQKPRSRRQLLLPEVALRLLGSDGRGRILHQNPRTHMEDAAAEPRGRGGCCFRTLVSP
jgi:hypothetical protein